MALHDTAFRLLQIIALALPAIALYLTVLVELYSESHQESGLEPTGVIKLTQADNELDFALALLSFVVLLVSAIFLIVSIAVPKSIILDIGTGILVLGFIVGLLAVATTAKRSIQRIRSSDYI